MATWSSPDPGRSALARGLLGAQTVETESVQPRPAAHQQSARQLQRQTQLVGPQRRQPSHDGATIRVRRRRRPKIRAAGHMPSCVNRCTISTADARHAHLSSMDMVTGSRGTSGAWRVRMTECTTDARRTMADMAGGDDVTVTRMPRVLEAASSHAPSRRSPGPAALTARRTDCTWAAMKSSYVGHAAMWWHSACRKPGTSRTAHTTRQPAPGPQAQTGAMSRQPCRRPTAPPTRGGVDACQGRRGQLYLQPGLVAHQHGAQGCQDVRRYRVGQVRLAAAIPRKVARRGLLRKAPQKHLRQRTRPPAVRFAAERGVRGARGGVHEEKTIHCVVWAARVVAQAARRAKKGCAGLSLSLSLSPALGVGYSWRQPRTPSTVVAL